MTFTSTGDLFYVNELFMTIKWFFVVAALLSSLDEKAMCSMIRKKNRTEMNKQIKIDIWKITRNYFPTFTCHEWIKKPIEGQTWFLEQKEIKFQIDTASLLDMSRGNLLRRSFFFLETKVSCQLGKTKEDQLSILLSRVKRWKSGWCQTI